MHGKGIDISSLLVMITLGLDMYIRNVMPLGTFIEFKAGSDNLLGIHTKSLRLNQGDVSSNFDSFRWSARLFPSYVHQGLYHKMDRWKKDIKLRWT